MKSMVKLFSLLLLAATGFYFFLQFDGAAAEDVSPEFHEIRPLGFPSNKLTKHSEEFGDESHRRDGRKAYIAYLGSGVKFRAYNATMASHYENMLKHIIGSNEPMSQYLLHVFEKSFHGCVAMLTDAEAKALASMEGVVSVFPNRRLHPQTTRSWDFLGMSLNVTRNTANESDIIIGVIDTGAWPYSKSFDDEGMGPVPSKWKGICDTSMNFTCNKKLIGARYFRTDGNFSSSDEKSARDTNGHGTHTASIAAGSPVPTASYRGIGSGTARGGVPSARVAIYKVCWGDGCQTHDLLRGFEAAIEDGVDLLSVSLGDIELKDYFMDPIAIGTFHAMKNGIFTAQSAGNYGPGSFSTTSLAPWHMSVAASTIDRTFITRVETGDNRTFQGISINPDDLENQELVYGKDGENKNSSKFPEFSGLCIESMLDPTLVKGKILLCDEMSNGAGPFYVGASGIIMSDSTMNKDPNVFPLPTSVIDPEDGKSIYKYIKSQQKPTGTIHKSIEGNDPTAPVTAVFSSRGPNSLSPGILKPDISAPGVAILAAWSGVSEATIEGDKTRVSYNFRSGTSMACPHVTGVAAYIKTFHPDWSPAAIKSALMTTATPMSPNLSDLREFEYGSGQINPLKAINPGLVYDAQESDYINFLCGEGYNETAIQMITGDNNFTCNQANSDLNYPSISLYTNTTFFISKFKRTVTNVGPSATSTYRVKVSHTESIRIRVIPDTLQFTTVGENKSFTVIVDGTLEDSYAFATGSMVWSDGYGGHRVRSPIVVHSLKYVHIPTEAMAPAPGEEDAGAPEPISGL